MARSTPCSGARSRRRWRRARCAPSSATSTLDLGIDWGDVDLVIHVGAPKGASRCMQRIGRSNHRLDEPSKAILVPSNRFEVLECRAALDAAEAGAQDADDARAGRPRRAGAAHPRQACAAPSMPTRSTPRCARPRPSATSRARRSTACRFRRHGGYALQSLRALRQLKPTPDGKLRIAHPRFAQHYRMNAGTIVAAPMIKVRLVGRRGRRDAQGA